MRILCGQIITPDEVLDNTIIAIEEGKVAALSPADGSHVDIDASDKTAVPGFIDIHCHGGLGHEVMDGTLDSIRATSAHLASHGVTSWLPSTVTASWRETKRAVAAVAHAMSEGSGGAQVLGANLEGPFMNATRAGAQPPNHLRSPDMEEMKRELGDLISTVRYVAVAGELPGALELIRDLTAMGIKVAIGHTDASYEEACRAFDVGATSLTHTYNAMRPLHHREPGVIAAAMLDERVTAELIWDNFHVHQAAARIAVQMKGFERLALISDAVSAAGLSDGNYFLSGQPIRVENGMARLTGGTIAGSTITLDQAVRNAAAYYPLQDAVKMSTVAPAWAIGMEDTKGRIVAGQDADLVLLNRDLSVNSTYIRGKNVQV